MEKLETSWGPSELDSDRFHVNVIKAHLREDSSLQELEAYCCEVGADLAIVRTAAENLSICGELQRIGYRIMDTLVYCHATRLSQLNILKRGSADRVHHNVRTIDRNDIFGVKEVAKNSYYGYRGHYQADERLDKRLSDDVYLDWASRSCMDVLDARKSNIDKKFTATTNEVFVVEIDKEIMAFMTMRYAGDDSGEAVLSGVHPRAQGKGIYQALIEEGMNWCRQRGRERMIVSTQIVNIAVQKVWARCGFEPFQYIYTFHKWFDEKRKSP